MTQNYIVPSIYSDMSNQGQGYFAFRFTCQQCYWQIDTRPIRSNVSTASNVIDIGAGLLGGFWGRAAEAGQKIYGSQWHTEQAEALQKSWAEVQHHFHFCPKCHRTVCDRCFNHQLNLCTGAGCAPDLHADGTQFQHQLNIEAQRGQIEQQYQAPQFNVNAIPSAATPDLLRPAPNQAVPQLPSGGQQPPLPSSPPSPASIAGFSTPGYPQTVECPNCKNAGQPGKFCQHCGTRLPLPDLFCPRCATPVKATAKFCEECGARLHSS